MAASSTNPAQAKILADILAFHEEAGASHMLDETAHDRFAESSEAAEKQGHALHPETRQRQEPQPQAAAMQADQRPMRQTAPQSPEAAALAAREAASSAATLDELKALYERFEGCELKKGARQLVFSDGVPGSRLMLIGEAPGQEEDRQGKPFVGRSGQLLDRMLATIGLDRSQVYIANVVPWRPPGNRTPTPHEIAVCKPFLDRQIALANPDLVICVGQPSTQTLLDTKEGITRTRGRWLPLQVGDREIRAMPFFHPAFLLRQPVNKRLAWRDLKAIRAALQALPER
jgi:uracil-DNA glycosylase